MLPHLKIQNGNNKTCHINYKPHLPKPVLELEVQVTLKNGVDCLQTVNPPSRKQFYTLSIDTDKVNFTGS